MQCTLLGTSTSYGSRDVYMSAPLSLDTATHWHLSVTPTFSFIRKLPTVSLMQAHYLSTPSKQLADYLSVPCHSSLQLSPHKLQKTSTVIRITFEEMTRRDTLPLQAAAAPLACMQPGGGQRQV